MSTDYWCSVYTVFRRTARLCTISSCAGAIGEAGAAISRYIDQIALKTARLDETSSLNGPHWRHRLNWRLVSECRTRRPGWLRAASSAIKTRRWPRMGRRRVSLWGDFSNRKPKNHLEEIRVPKQEGSTTVRQVQEEGVSKYISSSSVLQALRFVNTIISSKHYLKSFVVVVGGWEGLTGCLFTPLESRA